LLRDTYSLTNREAHNQFGFVRKLVYWALLNINAERVSQQQEKLRCKFTHFTETVLFSTEEVIDYPTRSMLCHPYTPGRLFPGNQISRVVFFELEKVTSK
jgi:hypothetical protein